MNWKTNAAIASSIVVVMTFLGGTTTYTYRAVGNDPMPLEGKREHASDTSAMRDALMLAITTLGNDIKADNLERRIEATCAMLFAARDTRAITMAHGLELQLAGYQAEHRRLIGADYPVPMCQ